MPALRLLLLLILTVPAAVVQAQTVGVLMPHRNDPNYPAFGEGLRALGYQEGRNLRLLERSADMKLEQLPALAKELVAAQVNVIVAINTPGARAAIQATQKIPIVMAVIGDPLGMGFVSNLARPGANVTGISNMSGELSSKRLSILKLLVPGAKRIAVLLNPVDPVTAPQIRDTERAAPALGIEVRMFPVKAVGEMEEAFGRMIEWRADAAVWLAGQAQGFQAPTARIALARRFPVMVSGRADVQVGGLISYSADNAELYRRTAAYVDRILKGAKAGELPVEQPTKFELAINLRTAKSIGLTVPQALLLQADQIIE